MRGMVSAKCATEGARRLVDQTEIMHSAEDITAALKPTDEMRLVCMFEDTFPDDGFVDMRPFLLPLTSELSCISLPNLVLLEKGLDAIRKITAFLDRNGSVYPCLKKISEPVAVYPEVLRQIGSIINKYGQVRDSASPQLAAIRSELRSKEKSITRVIHAVLKKAQADGIAAEDAEVIVRDGKALIPVNASDKRKITGIVVDESASGRTSFIEPIEAVNLNNAVRELQFEEQREIQRILMEFSDFLRPYLPDILLGADFLVQIDFIRAKALVAMDMIAGLPILSQSGELILRKARHPLLERALKKEGKEIVPLSLTLTGDRRIMLISGPNAGGKSVCLKTVGLLQYMFQWGLLIPTSEISEMLVFDNIFVDIGDDQNLENDLSTYSSHLQNLNHILGSATDRSLVLIDEFGSGTEPAAGGAIAEALLDLFNQKRSFGVITTHYTNLKNFATDTDGIINGAMLYDRHEMRPLFRLEIGNPGSSFAVEIARKIGLPETVIEQAIAIVGSDHVNLDKYLQDIIRDKRYWEGKRQAIRQKEKKIDELTTKYESELEDISTQRKAIIREAKQESKRILQEANAVVENTVRRIKEAQAGKEETKEARRLLENYKKEAKESDEKKDLLDLKIERIRQKKNQRDLQKEKMEIEKTLPAIGQNVRIKGHGGLGTLIEIKGGNATVAFGLMKTATKLSELEIVSNTELKRELKKEQAASNTTNIIHQKNIQFKREIDVRGMRGDEALQAVTYFIDDALILDVDQVRILHGTGNGILRQLIRDYLKSIPSVLQATDERVDLGGAGITVVKFQ